MKKELTFSPRTITNIFKKHFANLASDLLKKLLDPTGKFGIPSVGQYYKEINFHEKNLNLKINILKEFKTSKATGVDNVVGRFLKDGSNILYTYS